MDGLVGFHVGMWDYITCLALIVIAIGSRPPYREVLVLPSGGAPWKLC